MKTKNKNINRGAAILSIIFALLFFILISRFVEIEATGKADGQVLAVKAEQLYTKKRTIEAHRGEILDRNGDVIAEDTAAYTVVAILDKSLTVDKNHPMNVVDPQMTAEKLAPILDMNVSDVERILTKDKKQVEFGPNGRDISYDVKQKIEKLHLPGIAFIRDSKRYYPNGLFASHVIGYAQKMEDKSAKTTTVGMMGIEKEYDKYLREKNGYVYYESDSNGFALPKGKEKIVPPDNGDNIYLTIDQKIQSFLEDAMTQVQKEYQPKKMIAIVADPKTGRILAMADRPSFNPNNKNIRNFLNDAVAYRFEPGSTMKIYPLAAAIQEGVFHPNEKYQSGTYTVQGGRIKDHNGGVGWGKITFLEGVQRSSNVAFSILVNEKLGTERFLDYIHRFGLSKPTGIDIPGEVTSEIRYRYPLEKVTASFGQGIAITPIQQIQAASAVANDGKMMKPYVIDHIIDPDTGKVILQRKPIVAGTPISKETAHKVLDILGTVVTSPVGTGRRYFIKGYDVAGKTGTAQIPSPDGGYMTGKDNYIFSFMGMAPKNDPKLLIYIAVKQPKLKPLETGSEPVAAIFKPVMANSLQYLKIEPSINEQESTKKKKFGVALGDYHDENTSSVVADIHAEGLNPVVLGDGSKVIDQLPEKGVQVLPGERIILKTDGKITYPNFVGWSYRDVLKVTTLLHLPSSFDGDGYVISQNMKSGSPYNQNDLLHFKLEPPKETKKGKNGQATEALQK